MLNRLDSLRVFCAAADARSFREAATRLGVSPQVVTRAVRELEKSLGEVLFHRNTRQVKITSFGEQLAQRAREAVASLDDLYQAGAGSRSNASAEGVVRVTAPGPIGRLMLVQALAPFRLQHPSLVVDFRLSEVLSDVVDVQIDVGVRIGFLRDSRFVARPASKVSFFVVATPDLLARVGRPRSVDALFERPVTALIDRNTGRPWPWFFRGSRQVVPASPAFVTDDPEAECAAVLSGMAFGQLAGFHVLPHLKSGRLVSVLDGEAPDPWPIYVYRPRRAPVPPRVRVVYDQIIAALGREAMLPTR